MEYIGSVNTLCMDRRGTPLAPSPVDDKTVLLQYILPLSEVLVDFHDTLKSITSGFASFDYQDHGFHPSPLVRVSGYFIIMFFSSSENHYIFSYSRNVLSLDSQTLSV